MRANVPTKARSPGRLPSGGRPRSSIRRTASASRPIPALNAKRRPLTRPVEIFRVRSCSSASASCSAASSGSRGRPSARGRTLVPPPGTKPSGKSSRSTPFSTSLKPPSPEKTMTASASTPALRASSTAWRGRSVRTVRTYAARISARSTAETASSSTRLAKGLTIKTARFIVRSTMPRLDHVAVESPDPARCSAFYEPFPRSAHRRERRSPRDGLPATRRDRDPRRRRPRPRQARRVPRVRRRTGGPEARARRSGNRQRGTRSRDRRRPLLRRPGRASARSDHLSRRRVTAHAVQQRFVEPVGKRVRVGLRRDPRVRPVRRRERQQRRGAVVEVGAELAELTPVAKERAEPFLVAAALGEKLLAALALEVAPLANEDRCDVELLRDHAQVCPEREPDLVGRWK